MGVKVRDKLSAIKNRKSPSDKVSAKLAASKKLLGDETIAKARALLKGEKGDPGPMGPPGPKGDKGDPGMDGHTPVAGIDFIIYHAKDGRDGRNGRDGVTVVGASGDSELLDVTLTYTGDLVTRIDYEGGQFKTLTYNADSTINAIVWNRGIDVVTKTFAYNIDGNVESVTVTGDTAPDPSSCDGRVPYVGAISDVDLGNWELYSDGIHVDGITMDPPVGPGITLAYDNMMFGGGIIAAMNWGTTTSLPLVISGSTIAIDASDNVEIAGDTIELDGNIIGNIDCDDCNVTINSEDTNYGRFIVTGDNRTGFISKSTDTGSNSQFGLGVNVGGSLVTVTINAPGTDYHIGDVLLVLQAGAGADGGYVSVVDVDAGGGVIDIMIPFGCTGTAYIVANGLSTSGGYGTGCKINITGVTVGGYVFLQSSSIGTGTTRPIQLWTDNTSKFSVAADGTINIVNVSEHDDNAAALLATLLPGDIYRTGDLLKIVH